MTQKSNQQNHNTEQKQNIVEVEQNIDNGLETEANKNGSELTKLLKQIHFTAKILTEKEKYLNQTLNKLSADFKQTVEQTASKLNNANGLFQDSIKEQAKQYEILKLEVGVLTLLPEKTKEEITNIIPEVARELEKIQIEHTKSLHNSYNSIINSYAEGLKKYQIEIDQVSGSITENITKCLSAVDQKLEQYSNKLSTSANHVIEYSNFGFLKNMCFVVLFSAIISGVTAYAVTTQFPRYLTVTGANNVKIQDCNVSVLGKVKDNDNLMEQMTRKK